MRLEFNDPYKIGALVFLTEPSPSDYTVAEIRWDRDCIQYAKMGGEQKYKRYTLFLLYGTKYWWEDPYESLYGWVPASRLKPAILRDLIVARQDRDRLRLEIWGSVHRPPDETHHLPAVPYIVKLK